MKNNTILPPVEYKVENCNFLLYNNKSRNNSKHTKGKIVKKLSLVPAASRYMSAKVFDEGVEHRRVVLFPDGEEDKIFGVAILLRFYGFYIVEFTAAEKGFGPILYDICMETSPTGIVPDYTFIHQSAKNLYKIYFDERDDVVKVHRSELHDVFNNIHDHLENYLNYMYDKELTEEVKHMLDKGKNSDKEKLIKMSDDFLETKLDF
jgi:hypothetical protein